ncbi:MAG: hypothetical protein K0S47_2120 [Herbinix sp.]|jgi:histidinol-phosphate phosphatase family protein|nr:hypothetical protein [Herbinix sp.]
MKKPVVFLDFQGTLGGEGLEDITSFEFFPFALEAIQLLNKNNILAIGITNQSHISKGLITMEEYDTKLQLLKDKLAIHNSFFDSVYCCPHDNKDHCNCRKPLTGMIEKAKEEHDLDMQKAYVVGDMGMSDMVLAKNINAKGILVLTGVGRGSLNEHRSSWQDVNADYIAENVLEAVRWILNDLKINL